MFGSMGLVTSCDGYDDLCAGDNDVTGDADPALSPRPRHYLVFDLFPMSDSGKVKLAQVK